MSAFAGALSVTELDANVRCWRLNVPLVYEIDTGRLIEVPQGFVTDGASVPRVFWSVLPPWGRYSRAAVLHDLLCALLDKGTPHDEAPTRRDADAIFFDAMAASGVNVVTRWVLWIGVRIGSVFPGAEPNLAFD
jgi:hypothetical protein